MSQERTWAVRRNLLSKFNEVSPISDEQFANLVRDMEKIHNSPNISLDDEEKEEKEEEEVEEKKTAEFEKFLDSLLSSEVCGGCGGSEEEAELELCGRCQTVAYCEVRCQRKDWARHRRVCPQLAGLSGQEQKDLIKTVLSPKLVEKSGAVETETCIPETSIRTQFVTGSPKRFLPVLGRLATPQQGVDGFGISGKVTFLAVIVNDEEVEEADEILEVFGDITSQEVSRHGPPTKIIFIFCFQSSEDSAGLFSVQSQ